ncbi:MAG: formylglycine-generating enzyme family protein [Planctomycetota bacterium]
MKTHACCWTVGLLVGLTALAPVGAGEKESLAVVAFKVRGIEAAGETGNLVGELFSVKLGPYYRIVERVQVAKIIEAQQFQATDLVEDPKKAAKVGKLARARYVLVGSLNRLGEEYILVAKILDCDSGEQVKGGSTTFQGVSKLSHAVENVLQSMGLKKEKTQEDQPPVPPEGVILVRPGLYRSERDKALMVWVAAGKFRMGSEKLGAAERPVHEVKMKGFFIDRTEVTNRMFARYLNLRGKDVDENGQKMIFPDPRIGLTKWGDTWTPVKGVEEHPVVRVTWYGAVAYAKWAKKSLPTEAQWEYAARGKESRRYPWGNGAPNRELCVFGRRPPDRTLRAGQMTDGAAASRCLDMAGNVAEWCRDWFEEKFYETSPFADPVNLEKRDFRVHRGGSWYDTAEKILSARRAHAKPHFADDTLGFRCVKELQ